MTVVQNSTHPTHTTTTATNATNDTNTTNATNATIQLKLKNHFFSLFKSIKIN
jgi:hypothetical protein